MILNIVIIVLTSHRLKGNILIYILFYFILKILAWEHFRGSSEFPNQHLRQIGLGVPELCSDIQTDRQTEITTLYIDALIGYQ